MTYELFSARYGAISRVFATLLRTSYYEFNDNALQSEDNWEFRGSVAYSYSLQYAPSRDNYRQRRQDFLSRAREF